MNDECLTLYEEFKIRKKYKYIIFKLSGKRRLSVFSIGITDKRAIDDLKEIVVEKSAESGSYEEFLSQLPENEPRYAVYDFDFEKPGEGQRSKITFYAW